MTEGKRGQGDDSPRDTHVLAGTHNRSRNNVIERETDRSVKNEKRIRIMLMAIETIKMMSNDLATRVRKSWKRSGSR
jgi:hypothetical protein